MLSTMQYSNLFHNHRQRQDSSCRTHSRWWCCLYRFLWSRDDPRVLGHWKISMANLALVLHARDEPWSAVCTIQNYTELYGSLLTPTRLLAAKDKCPCFLPSSISLQSSNQITRIGCASEMLMLWKVLSCNVTNSACCFCRYTLECIHFIIYICISCYMNDASDIFIPCKKSRCSSVFYEPQEMIPDGPPQSSCKQASRTFTNLKLSWQSLLKPTQPKWTKAVTENRPTVVLWCIM